MADEQIAKPFEESLSDLESIVRLLEEGRLPLSEALARYEEGVKCLRECFTALKSAERKIELLVGTDANGKPILEAFEEVDETLDEKQQNRSRKRRRARADRVNEQPEAGSTGTIDTPKGLF